MNLTPGRWAVLIYPQIQWPEAVLQIVSDGETAREVRVNFPVIGGWNPLSIPLAWVAATFDDQPSAQVALARGMQASADMEEMAKTKLREGSALMDQMIPAARAAVKSAEGAST